MFTPSTTKNNQVPVQKDRISKLKSAVVCVSEMNTIVPGGAFLYLTKWGKASSLQKDRETKRTPAGVAGGRLVISWRSCSASSSVGLQREDVSNTCSTSTPLSFTETEASVKPWEDLPHSPEPT